MTEEKHYQNLMPDPGKSPPEIIFDDTIIAGITPMVRGAPFD